MAGKSDPSRRVSISATAHWTGGRVSMKSAIPRRVSIATAEAVLVALGYRVFRETFDLVAVRSLGRTRRFHIRIEHHGEPVVTRGAEVDVHVDFLEERGRHRSKAEGQEIAIETERLLDLVRRAKPAQDREGFTTCPLCGKGMANQLFAAHLKIGHPAT